MFRTEFGGNRLLGFPPDLFENKEYGIRKTLYYGMEALPEDISNQITNREKVYITPTYMLTVGEKCCIDIPREIDTVVRVYMDFMDEDVRKHFKKNPNEVHDLCVTDLELRNVSVYSAKNNSNQRGFLKSNIYSIFQPQKIIKDKPPFTESNIDFNRGMGTDMDICYTGPRIDYTQNCANFHGGLDDHYTSYNGSSLLGTSARETSRNNYFNMTYPYQHMLTPAQSAIDHSMDRIHNYSFALGPGNYQPTGTMNYSRIDPGFHSHHLHHRPPPGVGFFLDGVYFLQTIAQNRKDKMKKETWNSLVDDVQEVVAEYEDEMTSRKTLKIRLIVTYLDTGQASPISLSSGHNRHDRYASSLHWMG
jgi:hypothetical protein